MYTIKVLSSSDFDNLPYRRSKESLGVTDPDLNTAFVRFTAYPELNRFLIDHEFEHLIESVPTDEEDGVRYFGKGAIASLFGGLKNVVGGAARGIGGVAKGIGSGIQRGVSSLGNLGQQTPGSITNSTYPGMQGTARFITPPQPPFQSFQSFAKPIGAALGAGLNAYQNRPQTLPLGSPAGEGFNVGMGSPQEMQQSAQNLQASSSPNAGQTQAGGSPSLLNQGAQAIRTLMGGGGQGGQGGGTGSSLMDQFQNAAQQQQNYQRNILGLIPAGAGIAGASQAVPIPQIPRAEGIESMRQTVMGGPSALTSLAQGKLTELLNRPLQQVTDEELSPINRQFDIERERRLRELAGVYRSALPGNNYLESSSYGRDRNLLLEGIAGERARTLAPYIRHVNQANEQNRLREILASPEVQQMDQQTKQFIATADVQRIASQFNVNAQTAMHLKNAILQEGGLIANTGMGQAMIPPMERFGQGVEALGNLGITQAMLDPNRMLSGIYARGLSPY